MKYLYVALLGLLCFAVSLSAPFVVPFALLFTKRDADALAFSYYDTPDEPALIGLYEPTVRRISDKYGWFIGAWYWFGLRNRAHGFDSLWSKPAPGYWLDDVGMQDNGEQFYWRGHYPVFGLFEIHLSFGWAVYASKRYDTGYEYRPQMAVKTRRIIKDANANA